MASPKIAIVIPAYNEEQTIGSVIQDLNENLETVNYDVIIVNDYSKDNTSNIAGDLGVEVICLTSNHGYSKAIEIGMNHVLDKDIYDYILTMDADGQHSGMSVSQLLAYTKDNSLGLIIGERQEYARFSEKIYGLVYFRAFGIKDPLSGLKLYSTSEYKKIRLFETYDSIGTELMTRFVLKGVKFKTIPIVVRERLDEPRFGRGIKVNLRILSSLIKSLQYIIKHK
ncbi:glycosyltransferase family 2 protein [Vibrio gigantis]|uniref:glycosyltransferase family 2 protein n=1 Tax=Vibrio gigantis TaxID=296199 RepID=UPI0035A66E4E